MADKPTETAAPATHPETGVAMYGDYPLNSLLRAEALHADGKDEDEDGIVTPDAIKSAGERRAALDKAADDSKPAVRWHRDDLVAYAARIGAAHEGDANKPTILAAIEARQAEIDGGTPVETQEA